MGGDHVSGHFYLEGKYGLSYSYISPRWLRFDLFLDTRILPNQRGFFNFFDTKISINSGIGVHEGLRIINESSRLMETGEHIRRLSPSWQVKNKMHGRLQEEACANHGAQAISQQVGRSINQVASLVTPPCVFK